MKSLLLTIGTSYRFNFREVDFVSHPAFRAVCKGGGFYIGTSDSEFPAVNTESAVFKWHIFSRETLHASFHRRFNPEIFGRHPYQITFVHFSLFPFIPSYTGCCPLNRNLRSLLWRRHLLSANSTDFPPFLSDRSFVVPEQNIKKRGPRLRKSFKIERQVKNLQ